MNIKIHNAYLFALSIFLITKSSFKNFHKYRYGITERIVAIADKIIET